MPTTTEQVKQYTEELKKLKNPKSFNIFAFLLGGLYYFYKCMLKHFLLYLSVPWIICLIALIVDKSYGKTGLIAGFILTHTVAGIRANRDIAKDRKWYIEKYKDAEKMAHNPVAFFSVSLKRLFFFSLFSGGIYEIYWMYKNWKAVERDTKEEVSPVFRGWFFGVFFIYPLFVRMQRSIRKFKPVSMTFSLCTGFYTLIYVIMALIGYGPSFNSYSVRIAVYIFIALCAMSLISIFLLLPIQKEINANNKRIDKRNAPVKKFAIGEIITVFAGFAITGIVIIGILSSISVRTQEIKRLRVNDIPPIPQVKSYEKETWRMLANTYRHTSGYRTVCLEEGYLMKRYPSEFRKAFKNEIDNLENHLAKYGLSLDLATEIFEKTNGAVSREAIANELEDLRKQSILYHIAEEEGIPVEKAVFKKEYDGIVSKKDVCIWLDDNAKKLLSNNDELKGSMEKPAALFKAELTDRKK